MRRAGLLALVPLILAVPAAAAPGDLDHTFSGDGWVRTYDVRGAAAPNPPRDGARDVAVQPDGKIITVGPLESGPADGAFGAFRWLPNGGLDPGFASGGQVVVSSGQFDSAYAVALQKDGKILLAGEGDCPLVACAMLVRLNPDGRLDAGFGQGGLVIVSRIVCPSRIYALAVQRDGRIVVAGSRPRNDQFQDDAMFAFARFAPNGRLDRTFSRDGCVSVDFTSLDDRAYSLALQANGRILAAGMGSRRGSVDDFAFVRLRPNGSLDRTFSRDGRHTVDFGRSESARGVAVQPNGRIVAVGFTGPGPRAGPLTVAVTRLRRTGALDRSFGFGGRLLLRASPFGSFGADVSLLPGGRILLAGYVVESKSMPGSNWLLARLRTDGRLDRSFGRGGLVVGDFGTGEDWAGALAVQRDGKIVVAGQVYMDQAVARYVAR